MAAVVGDPVRHSLSPALHNAAFAALGLDWVYVAFPVVSGGGREAVAAMRALGFDGLNVTMPLKEEVAAAVDRLSPTAEALRSVNTVVRRGDELVGESTDGDGLVRALRVDEGVQPEGRRFLVVGAGGAARAVVHALGAAGAAEVVVVARRHEAAEACAALAPTGRVGTGVDVGAADVVINATPVGMAGVAGDELPVDAALLGPGQVVVDLVYRPVVTPLLHAARAQGAAAVTGLGMLLHQAALSFRAWTGEDPPLEVMSAAATAELSLPD